MTGIQWTDETWNPVVGCTRVSAGCDHCYAVAMTHRLEKMAEADEAYGRNAGKKARYRGLTVLNPRGDRHFNGVVRCVESALAVPLSWQKPRRVFVNSMSDLFHRDVPFEFIDRVFAVMALCPQHTFQVLTKRPERMAEYMTQRRTSKAWTPSVRAGDGGGDAGKWKTPCDDVYAIAREMRGRDAAPSLIWPLPNVWLGTSCEDQAAADARIPHLLRCPAAVRFLSCEPLLGEVDLWAKGPPYAQPHLRHDRINWVIVGGESGKNARLCDVGWIRSVVGLCRAVGVPCFVKQLGADAVYVRKCKACGGTGAVEVDGIDEGCRVCRQTRYQSFSMKLGDPKGGDPAEWPEDLRVRQMPEERRRGDG